MRRRELAIPARMSRVAVVAPRARLREALVALADAGTMELVGAIPPPQGEAVEALRRWSGDPDGPTPRSHAVLPSARTSPSSSDEESAIFSPARWSSHVAPPQRSPRLLLRVRRLGSGRSSLRESPNGWRAPVLRSSSCRSRHGPSPRRCFGLAARLPVPPAGRDVRGGALRGHRPDAVRCGLVRVHVRDDVRRRRPGARTRVPRARTSPRPRSLRDAAIRLATRCRVRGLSRRSSAFCTASSSALPESRPRSGSTLSMSRSGSSSRRSSSELCCSASATRSEA